MNVRENVYRRLKSAGFSAAGIAGIMGNIEAESAFRPDNVEDRSGIDDATYTKMVDEGTYIRDIFENDAYGYGLCQWTYHTRKARLYRLCKSKGVSIADVDAQMDLLIAELQEYTSLYATLQTSNDYLQCAKDFMRIFENPADQSASAIAYRQALAKPYYDTIYDGEITVEQAAPDDYDVSCDVTLPMLEAGDAGRAVSSLQALLTADGYDVGMCGVDGIFGGDTDAAVRQMQADYGLDVDGIVGPQTWSTLIG